MGEKDWRASAAENTGCALAVIVGIICFTIVLLAGKTEWPVVWPDDCVRICSDGVVKQVGTCVCAD